MRPQYVPCAKNKEFKRNETNSQLTTVLGGEFKTHNLPPEMLDYLPELKLMLTEEEAKTEENNKLALDALKFGKNEEKKEKSVFKNLERSGSGMFYQVSVFSQFYLSFVTGMYTCLILFSASKIFSVLPVLLCSISVLSQL